MIPALLKARLAQLDPQVQQVLTFLNHRLGADLSDLEVVKITYRAKSPESILQKLQTGKYTSVGDLHDLAAVTVVLLHKREVHRALDIVRNSGLTIIDEPSRIVAATDFRHHEPKLLVKPPSDFLERNEHLSWIVAEVQFTSALQHALDMATHDFDYKGITYSWSNFRLVAQLRGLLELVDNMIDDIESVTLARHETADPPTNMLFTSRVLDVLVSKFSDEALPADRRRLADNVAAWTTAAEIDEAELGAILDRHSDLVSANSLDASSAALGALFRERGELIISNFSGNFAISEELESLCSEVSLIPEGRRIGWRIDQS